MEYRKWYSPMPRPPKRNGRDEKSPDGRSSDRTITTPKTRFDDRPSSQPFNGQTQMRAWQGEGAKRFLEVRSQSNNSTLPKRGF
ncbi:hypothetical protein DEV91_1031 [Phyllobacterium brassicacearum]|nr:hypothetical protein DEV91_1031 [Phyllobacterium brassicacearum]